MIISTNFYKNSVEILGGHMMQLIQSLITIIFNYTQKIISAICLPQYIFEQLHLINFHTHKYIETFLD